MRKKYILMLLCILILVIIFLSPKIIYFWGYVCIPLEKVEQMEYPMNSLYNFCHFDVLNSEKEAIALCESKGIRIPGIDLNNKTLIITYGSELRKLKINHFDTKIRNMHVGHAVYASDTPQSIICFYITEKIQLTPNIQAAPWTQ